VQNPSNKDIFDLLDAHVTEQKTVKKLLIEIRDQVTDHAQRISALETESKDTKGHEGRLSECEKAIVKIVAWRP